MMKGFRRNNKGGIELDELGKLILGVIIFIILIYIVTIVIGGEMSSGQEEVGDVFNAIK